MLVNAIAAMDLASGIGLDGKIPWKCSDDLKRFRRFTMGDAVVMGRKTVESLPGALDGRFVCMLTRKPGGYPDSQKSQMWFNSLTECLDTLRLSHDRVWIAGGEEIYTHAFALEVIDQVWLTVMNGVWGCDVHFPINSLKDFKSESVENFNDHSLFHFVR